MVDQQHPLTSEEEVLLLTDSSISDVSAVDGMDTHDVCATAEQSQPDGADDEFDVVLAGVTEGEATETVAEQNVMHPRLHGRMLTDTETSDGTQIERAERLSSVGGDENASEQQLRTTVLGKRNILPQPAPASDSSTLNSTQYWSVTPSAFQHTTQPAPSSAKRRPARFTPQEDAEIWKCHVQQSFAAGSVSGVCRSNVSVMKRLRHLITLRTNSRVPETGRSFTGQEDEEITAHLHILRRRTEGLSAVPGTAVGTNIHFH